MRRTALAAAFVAAVAAFAPLAPAANACGSPNCEQVNELCYAALRTYCLR